MSAPRPRLSEVAARAGVSEKTVSNVINNYPHVTERTRSKVQDALTELNYRVNLSARSLASGAPMILMDEPFAALDAQTRTDMQEQLLAIVRAERRCVIFVTHDVDEGILLGDRLVVMGTRPGHIIEDFQNPLGTQRGSDMFASPAYGTFKQQVTELIRGRHHTTIEIGSTND